MNYYRDPLNGDVYAYDDQQVADGLVLEGLVPMTQEEIEAHLNPPATLPYDPATEPANPTVEQWNALCDAARAPELKK